MHVLGFSEALTLMRSGVRMQRVGWNGSGMYVVAQRGYPEGVPINENTARVTGLDQGTVCVFLPYLMMKTVDNTFVPWLPSQADLFAFDWQRFAEAEQPR